MYERSCDKMKPSVLTRIAMMACMQYVVFTMFSQVLYLEAVTLITLLFAVVFPLRESMLASVIFACVNMLTRGVMPWTIMYLILFPLYSLLGYTLRTLLISRNEWTLLICFLFSFLLGQLVDLPFILFSGKITMIYMLMGLKTSLIQGFLSACEAAFLFDPLYRQLMKIRGGIRQ